MRRQCQAGRVGRSRRTAAPAVRCRAWAAVAASTPPMPPRNALGWRSTAKQIASTSARSRGSAMRRQRHGEFGLQRTAAVQHGVEHARGRGTRCGAAGRAARHGQGAASQRSRQRRSRRAVEVVRRGDRLAAVALQHADAQHAVAAGDVEAVAAGAQQRARARRHALRSSATAPCRRRRSPATTASAIGQGLNARTLFASTSRRLRPVEACLGLVELVRVGDALFGLRLRHRPDAGAQQAQAIGQHLRAERGQAVVQLAAGLVLADRSVCDSSTGPVSRPFSICIRHTPISLSPASIARWIGAAPRQRGSSEACTFQQP